MSDDSATSDVNKSADSVTSDVNKSADSTTSGVTINDESATSDVIMSADASITAAAASPSRTASTVCAKRGAKTRCGHPASSYLLLFLLLPVFLLLALAAQPVACGPAEDRLIATVLKGYNPLARPVEDGAVDVWFGMGLIQILQIVEVEQTVKSNVWLRLIWYGLRLSILMTQFSRACRRVGQLTFFILNF